MLNERGFGVRIRYRQRSRGRRCFWGDRAHISCSLTGVPEGSYTLCAMIDPENTNSEFATASDNDVKSDAPLWVEDC